MDRCTYRPDRPTALKANDDAAMPQNDVPLAAIANMLHNNQADVTLRHPSHHRTHDFGNYCNERPSYMTRTHSFIRARIVDANGNLLKWLQMRIIHLLLYTKMCSIGCCLFELCSPCRGPSFFAMHIAWWRRARGISLATCLPHPHLQWLEKALHLLH